MELFEEIRREYEFGVGTVASNACVCTGSTALEQHTNPMMRRLAFSARISWHNRNAIRSVGARSRTAALALVTCCAVSRAIGSTGGA